MMKKIFQKNVAASKKSCHVPRIKNIKKKNNIYDILYQFLTNLYDYYIYKQDYYLCQYIFKAILSIGIIQPEYLSLSNQIISNSLQYITQYTLNMLYILLKNEDLKIQQLQDFNKNKEFYQILKDLYQKNHAGCFWMHLTIKKKKKIKKRRNIIITWL